MGRKTTFSLVLAALLLIPLQPVRADIYQYTDEQGVVHFSNVSIGSSRNYKRIKSEPAKEQHSSPKVRSVSPSAAKLSSSNQPSAYVDIISSVCNRHGVDPALVHAIVKIESDFNPFALSKKGAMGLMQLMPQTAVDMNVGNSFNPYENIDGGVKYLRYLIDRYEGNLSLALAAYNSGETAVKKWGTIPPYAETQNYVQRILKIYNGGMVVKGYTTRYTTIYMGYGEDGALIITDDPSKQPGKKFARKTSKEL